MKGKKKGCKASSLCLLLLALTFKFAVYVLFFGFGLVVASVVLECVKWFVLDILLLAIE
jgi:hypothetical protein